MRIPLDTHAFWWAAMDPERLSEWGRAALLDESNEIHVSVVTWWELVLKRGRGKLGVPNPDSFLPEVTRRLGVESVLVAQARCEGLTLMMIDRQVRAYPVTTVW